MQKLMKAMHKNEKGFTLVELMVVVVIIGILVAIAIPLFGAVQTNAANRAHESNIRILQGAGQMLIADQGFDSIGTYTLADPGALDDFVEDWPLVPDRANVQDADVDAAQTYTVEVTSTDDVYNVIVTVVAQ